MTESNLTTTQQETTPFHLIQMAIDKDLDVDKLERLLDMQKSWQTEKAKQSYFQAMNNVQSTLPRVIRDKENSHTKSMYATLEAVNLAVVPVFTENGFSISFNEVDCVTPDSLKLVATVRHAEGHEEQFSAVIPLDGVGIKGNSNKTATQTKGSTIAYGRRYLMLMIGNITVVNEDTDGNSAETTLSEEQLVILRTKFHDHFDLGIGNFPTVEALESKFVVWLAAQQKTPDVTRLEDIHSAVFPRAISTLDGKLRSHQVKS